MAPLVGTTLPIAQRNITEVGFQITSRKFLANIDAAEHEGYIDEGDGCWRRDVLETRDLRCW